MATTVEDLRRLAVNQSLFPPTTLKRALHKMGFVQADPIRAPARAQDLILRHRVKGYHAGDLERRYSQLGIEEDFFINYGFVTSEVQAMMHPRSRACVPAEGLLPWPAGRRKRAAMLLEFIRERGPVHPRVVDEHFAHGRVTNYWGGSSNATTHLLDAMHYRGLLRVVRRDRGIRIYAVHQHKPRPDDKALRRELLDKLAEIAIRIYAPLPGKSLSFVLRRLRYAAPQWERELTAAIHRAKEGLAHARVEGVEWFWPKDFKKGKTDDTVRLLTPFDPVVWDRYRFELLWGWTYRFEAYTPAPKRKLGYYALPLLWRDGVIGWGNVSVRNGEMKTEIGYVSGMPTEAAFQRGLDEEIERMREFLKSSLESRPASGRQQKTQGPSTARSSR
jgi:uncharacterized protein YcaQ